MRFLTTAVATWRVSVLAGLAVVALLCGVTAAAAQSNRGESGYSEKQIELEVLIEALEEYGRWRQHDVYGEVWIPEVGDDWRPYTIGQWAYHESGGWTWVSDEPFGWVVYHYGRWSRDDDFGWFWVPGTTWAPAWVAWREADEYIGWAPLPPEPPDYTGPPYEHTIIYDEPRYETFWVFAKYSLFVEPHVHRHIFWHRHPHYRRVFRKSRRGHHARWRNRRVVNRGVSLRELRERAKRDVRPAHAVVTHRKKNRGERHRHDGRRLVNVYRPEAAAKPRRARRQQAERRFHNLDERRAGPRRARPNPRHTKPGEARPRSVPRNTAAPHRRRANSPGGSDLQRVQRSGRRAAAKPVKPRARPRVQRRTHSSATAKRRAGAQRRSAQKPQRNVRPQRSVRRGGSMRPSANRARARARPSARTHAARPRQRAANSRGSPRGNERGRGGRR